MSNLKFWLIATPIILLVAIIAIIPIVLVLGVNQTLTQQKSSENQFGRMVVDKSSNRFVWDKETTLNSEEMLEQFNALLESAEQGDRDAQYKVGDHYYHGLGIPRNFVEAVKWYKKSAEQGNAWGENNLAVCYANGRGVPKNEKEAFHWYTIAAKQGHAPAQSNLGACYFYGLGTSVDHAEAVNWYRKAAEQEDHVAQLNLAFCYEAGTGVTNDSKLAAKWFLKSAEHGNAIAQWKYSGYCYGRGDTKEMIRWLHESASQDFAAAQYNLGILYERGEEASRDREAAIQWMRKAAANGDQHAKEWLKEHALNGRPSQTTYRYRECGKK